MIVPWKLRFKQVSRTRQAQWNALPHPLRSRSRRGERPQRLPSRAPLDRRRRARHRRVEGHLARLGTPLRLPTAAARRFRRARLSARAGGEAARREAADGRRSPARAHRRPAAGAPAGARRDARHGAAGPARRRARAGAGPARLHRPRARARRRRAAVPSGAGAAAHRAGALRRRGCGAAQRAGRRQLDARPPGDLRGASLHRVAQRRPAGGHRRACC